MPEFKKETFESDDYYKRWVATYKNRLTAKGCRRAMTLYVEYTGKTPTQLITEASEDMMKPPHLRTRVALVQVSGFGEWLLKSAPKLDHFKNVIGKGVSSSSMSAYVAYVRSFYANYEIIMKFSGRFELPEVEFERRREIFTNDQLLKLYESTRKIKDKALVLFLFQSGADVSTALGVKYKEVRAGLEGGDMPLKVKLYRPKTQVSYFSYIGPEAVNALKSYLGDLKSRGVELKDEDPLWIQERRVITERGKDGRPAKYNDKIPLTVGNAVTMIRESCERAGLIKEDAEFNGYGAHALRASFATKLKDAGMDKLLCDRLLGHKTPMVDQAYFKTGEDELRALYGKFMHVLAIVPASNNGELKKKIEIEVDSKTEALLRRLASLEQENRSLAARVAGSEKKFEQVLELLKGMKPEFLKLLTNNHNDSTK